MNYPEILAALREFTSRDRVDFLPLAPDPRPLSAYEPIQKYVLDLKNAAKPETAAEDLFGALCRDVLELQPTRQVGVTSGYVDFIARELYGLARDDWKHLTGTFTFGSGDSKAELDEIIRQSLARWPRE